MYIVFHVKSLFLHLGEFSIELTAVFKVSSHKNCNSRMLSLKYIISTHAKIWIVSINFNKLKCWYQQKTYQTQFTPSVRDILYLFACEHTNKTYYGGNYLI